MSTSQSKTMKRQFKGIEEAAKETRRISVGWDRVQIAYDLEFDEVYCHFFPNTTDWVEYHDPVVISYFAGSRHSVSELKAILLTMIEDME